MNSQAPCTKVEQSFQEHHEQLPRESLESRDGPRQWFSEGHGRPLLQNLNFWVEGENAGFLVGILLQESWLPRTAGDGVVIIWVARTGVLIYWVVSTSSHLKKSASLSRGIGTSPTSPHYLTTLAMLVWRRWVKSIGSVSVNSTAGFHARVVYSQPGALIPCL